MMRSRHFDGAPRSVGEARGFAADVMLDGAGVKSSWVLLVVSELASNAVMHAVGGYDVSLDATTREVAVNVRDSSSGSPQITWQAGPLAVGGRGLRIVAALSTSWGYDPLPGGGKVVWAKVPVRPGSAAARSRPRVTVSPAPISGG